MTSETVSSTEQADIDETTAKAGEIQNNPDKYFYFDENNIMRSPDPAFSNITSLCTILKLWNVGIDFEAQCEEWKNHTGYFSFWSEAAKSDLQATFLHLDFQRLKALAIPCILQVQDADFRNLQYIVFLGYDKDKLYMGNSTEGFFEISEKDLNQKWNGVSVLIWKNILNLTRELREGMSGEDVKKVEEIFRNLGYFKGIPPTDYFSSITSAVVKHFQTSTGILVDGIVGPETKIALYTRIENSDYPSLIIK